MTGARYRELSDNVGGTLGLLPLPRQSRDIPLESVFNVRRETVSEKDVRRSRRVLSDHYRKRHSIVACNPRRSCGGLVCWTQTEMI